MPGEEINYPEPQDALTQHLRDTHHNLAAGGLTAAEALEQHYQEHHGPGGLRNHDEPADLHDWEAAYVQGPVKEALEKFHQDAADVLREVDTALAEYPAGWAERRRPSFGDPEKVMGPFPATEETERSDEYDEAHLRALRAQYEDGADGRAMLAKMALPTLDAQPDDGLERRRALRPGSQPLPVPQEGVAGAHDLVMEELRILLTRRQTALRYAGKTKEAEAVRHLLKEIETDLMERRALGLRRYGSLLQPGNGRDPLRDAYEEVQDLVVYFRQLMMARDEAVTLLVELLNDCAVGEDPVVREKVGRVMYLLAGAIEKGSNDASG